MYHVTGLNTKLSRFLKFNTEVISFFNRGKEKTATYPFSAVSAFVAFWKAKKGSGGVRTSRAHGTLGIMALLYLIVEIYSISKFYLKNLFRKFIELAKWIA